MSRCALCRNDDIFERSGFRPYYTVILILQTVYAGGIWPYYTFILNSMTMCEDFRKSPLAALMQLIAPRLMTSLTLVTRLHSHGATAVPVRVRVMAARRAFSCILVYYWLTIGIPAVHLVFSWLRYWAWIHNFTSSSTFGQFTNLTSDPLSRQD